MANRQHPRSRSLPFLVALAALMQALAALLMPAQRLPAQRLPAQGGAARLDLRIDGGSLPGTIEIDLAGGLAFQQSGLIFLSLTTGPTPLALVDLLDPRSLDVGLELSGVAISGPFLVGGLFDAPALPVPNLPQIVDRPLYFQGLSVPGQPRLVDRLSLPRAVRFAPTGAFRDRFVALSNPRSFFPVLPGDDGRVLAAGGGSGAIFAQVARKDSEWFDPVTDSFSPGPDMTVERSLQTATTLPDGRVLIVGGVDGLNDPLARAEIWDPVAGSFTATGSMATPRMGHDATLLLDGRVLVSGGITDLNAPVTPIDPIFSITRSTEIFDPATGRFTAGPQLRAPRAGHHSIRRGDGRVLLCGGVSWSLFFPQVLASTDVFHPGTGTISAGPSMLQARAQGTTTPLQAGRWLLAGGVGTISLTQWGTPTDRAEIYDQAGDRFIDAGRMAARRALHVAFPIGGGRVMLAGGGDGTLFALTPLGSSEIFDSSTGLWSAGPLMQLPRTAPGLYRTATGQAHLLGGEGPNTVDRSTEFYYR